MSGQPGSWIEDIQIDEIEEVVVVELEFGQLKNIARDWLVFLWCGRERGGRPKNRTVVADAVLIEFPGIIHKPQ